MAPTRSLAIAMAYVALFALGVLGWGFSALNAHVADGPARDAARCALKLVTMAAVPSLLLWAAGDDVRALLRPRLPRRLMLPLVVVAVALGMAQALLGRGWQTLAALHPRATTLLWAAPLEFAWLVVDTAIPEELFFRVFLQTRLAAWSRSELVAVVVAAALFGLAHAPGLYLRGGAVAEELGRAPTVGWAISYSLTAIAPMGLVFGALWSRTRSFGFIVLAHAWFDLPPNLARLLAG